MKKFLLGLGLVLVWSGYSTVDAKAMTISGRTQINSSGTIYGWGGQTINFTVSFPDSSQSNYSVVSNRILDAQGYEQVFDPSDGAYSISFNTTGASQVTWSGPGTQDNSPSCGSWWNVATMGPIPSSCTINWTQTVIPTATSVPTATPTLAPGTPTPTTVSATPIPTSTPTSTPAVSSTTYKVVRRAYGPGADPVYNDTASCPGGLTGIVGGRNITWADFGLLPTDKPLMLRIRLLGNGSSGAQIAVKAETGKTFPPQGIKVKSVGAAGSTARAVEVFQKYPDPLSFFDVALYSGGNLIKN